VEIKVIKDKPKKQAQIGLKIKDKLKQIKDTRTICFVALGAILLIYRLFLFCGLYKLFLCP